MISYQDTATEQYLITDFHLTDSSNLTIVIHDNIIADDDLWISGRISVSPEKQSCICMKAIAYVNSINPDNAVPRLRDSASGSEMGEGAETRESVLSHCVQ